MKAKEGYQNSFLELALREESGLGREGGRKGIAEYLETKLGGFSIYCIESAGGSMLNVILGGFDDGGFAWKGLFAVIRGHRMVPPCCHLDPVRNYWVVPLPPS